MDNLTLERLQRLTRDGDREATQQLLQWARRHGDDNALFCVLDTALNQRNDGVIRQALAHLEPTLLNRWQHRRVATHADPMQALGELLWLAIHHALGLTWYLQGQYLDDAEMLEYLDEYKMLTLPMGDLTLTLPRLPMSLFERWAIDCAHRVLAHAEGPAQVLREVLALVSAPHTQHRERKNAAFRAGDLAKRAHQLSNRRVEQLALAVQFAAETSVRVLECQSPPTVRQLGPFSPERRAIRNAVRAAQCATKTFVDPSEEQRWQYHRLLTMIFEVTRHDAGAAHRAPGSREEG